VPHKFRYLSTRLVTQNGILVMGVAALAILLWTRGQVTLLVVLYSISVFLTFAVSLFGLCLYWWRQRRSEKALAAPLLLSLVGFVICAGILLVLLFERFLDGGWATAVIIAAIASLCIFIRNHYRDTKAAIRSVDEVFAHQPFGPYRGARAESRRQTAVFIVGTSRGGGLHALLWVQRMFPGHFKNFMFVNARTVDSHAYGGEGRDGADARGGVRDAALLRRFLQQPRHGVGRLHRLRHRRGGRGGAAVRGDQQGLSECDLLHQQTDLRGRQLVHAAAAQPGGAAVQRRLHLEGLADGDFADEGVELRGRGNGVAVRRTPTALSSFWIVS
jgi:hypothetical protein